jgi:hypothetical protein
MQGYYSTQSEDTALSGQAVAFKTMILYLKCKCVLTK